MFFTWKNNNGGNVEALNLILTRTGTGNCWQPHQRLKQKNLSVKVSPLFGFQKIHKSLVLIISKYGGLLKTKQIFFHWK